MAWPRPGSSAYPVLSLQSLLTTALGTGLAPGCSRPGQGRGRPVLWGRRWSRLFPLGVLKQMLHAPRLRQQLACLHRWAPGKGPQGHLWSVSPSSRQRQCQALLGSPSAAGKTVLGEPQARETQQWTPVGHLGPPLLLPLAFPWTPRLERQQHPASHGDSPSPQRASHPASTPGTYPPLEPRAFSGPRWPVQPRRRTERQPETDGTPAPL